MKARWTTWMVAAVFAAVFALTGCEGDDGDDGAPGAQGDAGLACWYLNENGIKDLPDEDLNGDANLADGQARAGVGSGSVELSAPR